MNQPDFGNPLTKRAEVGQDRIKPTSRSRPQQNNKHAARHGFSPPSANTRRPSKTASTGPEPDGEKTPGTMELTFRTNSGGPYAIQLSLAWSGLVNNNNPDIPVAACIDSLAAMSRRDTKGRASGPNIGLTWHPTIEHLPFPT